MTFNNIPNEHIKKIFSYLNKQDSARFVRLAISDEVIIRAIVTGSQDKKTIYSKDPTKIQDKINLINNNNIGLNHEETLDIIKQDYIPVTKALIENQNRELNHEAILEILNVASHGNDIINNHLLKNRLPELRENPDAVDAIIACADETTIIDILRAKLLITEDNLELMAQGCRNPVLTTMINEGYLDHIDQNTDRAISNSGILETIVTYKFGDDMGILPNIPEADALESAFNEMVRRRTRATERNQMV